MLDAFTLKGLWALVAGYGFGTSVFAGALAFAWFSPVFKKTALWVALGTAIVTTSYGIGVRNGSARVQAKWDAALTAAIDRAKDARSDAERDIARDVLDGVRNDRFNRDDD